MITPQETNLLQNFLNQLAQIKDVSKDPQADRMIADAFARQPDAGYLLVQRTLLQDQALEAARAQITQLQAMREESGDARSGSFFNAANTWGNSAGSLQRSVPPSPVSPMQPYEAVPQGVASRPGFFGAGSGSSFLGSMAATAAGVAGGALLFQGIESLIGQHGNGLPGQHTVANLSDAIASNPHSAQSDQLSTENGQASLLDSDLDQSPASDASDSNDDLGSDDDMSSI